MAASDVSIQPVTFDEIAPTTYRYNLLGSLRNDSRSLYAYTDRSRTLIATRANSSEGNIILKDMAVSPITWKPGEFKPATTSSMFKETDGPTASKYEYVTIDQSTQQLLKASGVYSINGVSIPKNPNGNMYTGLIKHANGIYDSGVFKKVGGAGQGASDSARDANLMVTSRVPDAVNYNYAKNQGTSGLSQREREHPQFKANIATLDAKFEAELAQARYLSGVMPYLNDHQAKEFDHFTYWKYKQVNTSNIFRGAYVHIFITRPDLHIFDRMESGREFRTEVLNDPDMATTIYMNPELALSLVDREQTGAMTNLNLFLSNRATAVSFDNEATDDHQFVEGFNKIAPSFGGRADNPPGQLDIIFNETQDLSVSNSALMWMRYIHLTYTGKISPLFDRTTDPLQMKREIGGVFPRLHPMFRRHDSLASIYIMATDMTQRNLIFWRKYFGVYPKGTAYAGLSKSQGVGLSEGSRTSQIPFKYITFRTNSMTDLYAFNRLSALDYALSKGFQTWDPQVSNDYENIAGLPFVAIEQNISSSLDRFNYQIPTKMYMPKLMFARTDGAFIPSSSEMSFKRNFIGKYWGDIGQTLTSADAWR